MLVNTRHRGNSSSDILSSTTASANSSEFSISDGSKATIFCDKNILPSEEIKLQIKKPDNTFIDVYSDGYLLELSATNNTFTMYGKGIYRIVKSVTADPIGIYAYNISFDL